MKILILGAGGIGGYFGARIHNAGGDVTFLVKPARADYLRSNGLHVFSPLGNIHVTPKIITAVQDNPSGKFDIVILSCKAYDLDSAIDAVAPALASQGLLVPLLNGFAHLAQLDAKFSHERVLGGLAHLGVTVTPEGDIQHLNELHRLVIGPRSQSLSPLIAPLSNLLAHSGIDFSLSERIESEMWDKFVFLTTLASATCTMRTGVGDILKTHWGEEFILGLLGECSAIAQKYGHQPSQERLSAYQSQLTARDSTSKASMLRDIERSGRTETEHIVGDMVHRAKIMNLNVPLLKIAYSHLQAYEVCRNRP